MVQNDIGHGRAFLVVKGFPLIFCVHHFLGGQSCEIFQGFVPVRDDMVYVDNKCRYGAALDDLRHDLLAGGDGPGFFRQCDVVLFAFFLGFFLFCFVLKCFDGTDGGAL